MSEINVYVIENNQPFENWFGTWEYFQTIEGISGFYVKNNKEELILVNPENVFEVNTNLLILDYTKLDRKKNTLLRFGLTLNESILFIELLNKMTIPNEEQKSFEEELGENIPFEGGICLGEALVALLSN
jgi:hypothetical protein